MNKDKARQLARMAEQYFDADDDEFVVNFTKDILAALDDDGWIDDYAPERSGYYLVYQPLMKRQHIVWFDNNNQRFQSNRIFSYWRELPAPPQDGDTRVSS